MSNITKSPETKLNGTDEVKDENIKDLAKHCLTPEFWSLNLLYCLDFLVLNDINYSLRRVEYCLSGQNNDDALSDAFIESIDIKKTERKIENHINDLKLFEKLMLSEDNGVQNVNECKLLYCKIMRELTLHARGADYSVYDNIIHGEVSNFNEFYSRFLDLSFENSYSNYEALCNYFNASNKKSKNKSKVIKIPRKK